MSWAITGTYKGAAVSDADAQAYLRAVEQADNQGPLEQGVQQAVNQFVRGCKADGIWDAIKASCILAGARTLTGALVPLVGSAPTNVNFVSGDYNRKTGLVGDGSTKYLNSNRNNNTDPQNSNHNSIYISSAATVLSHLIGSHPLATTGGNSIFTGVVAGNTSGAWNRSNGSTSTALPQNLAEFVGHSRNSSGTFSVRNASSTSGSTVTSSSPADGNVLVFCRGTPAASFTNARLAFYSIGESLDLALLNARVTTLVNAFAAAIP
jgi:hypothetical protein